MAGGVTDEKKSLLIRYDVPIENLSYEHIKKCNNTKELEKIVKILRSGEEGNYPDLLSFAEKRLSEIYPKSRVLQKEEPLLKKEIMCQDEWKVISDEMKEWTENIKAVDEELQRSDLKLRELPPVRGSKSSPSLLVQEVKKPQEAEKPPKKLKNCVPRSYSEWDTFDPEKELMKMEIAEEKEEMAKKRLSQTDIKDETTEAKRMLVNSTGESVSDDLVPSERNIMALQEKDKGNEFFHSKDYKNAVICYTTSIKLCSSVAAYNNRAMAYLRLGNHQGVIDDCSYVLNVDPNNVKALMRRGTAYKDLQNWSEAYKDFERATQLEPNSQQAQSMYKYLERKCFPNRKPVRIPICEDNMPEKSSKIVEISNTKSHPRQSKSLSTDFGSTSCLTASSETAVKRNRVLVPMREIIPKVNRWGQVRYDCCCKGKVPRWVPRPFPKCAVCEMEGKPPDYDCQQHRSPPIVEHMQTEEIPSSCGAESVPPQEVKTDDAPDINISSMECDTNSIKTDSAIEKNGSHDESKAEKTNDQQTRPESPVKSKTRSVSELTIGKREPRKVNVAKKYEKVETKSSPASSEKHKQHTAVNKEGPCSPFEFIMKWESLKNCTELKEHAKLLSTLKPVELPRALGTKMDADMLKKILHCLNEFYTTEDKAQLLASYLENLTKVERFSTVLLFLDKSEKKVINKLFDVLNKFEYPVPHIVKKMYFN